ncbi:hypothetical protein SLEP1_g27246 [Rubroshorea leprosula]|uniref:Uncharacterized protein n=1 Tax=Rubroshorea leprosula TaxID=152421 RepID=A0AAV5JZ28_9ROSI|nr:hypothetical protein SLEP1_g27246 [Rubroshorea leprosula]
MVMTANSFSYIKLPWLLIKHIDYFRHLWFHSRSSITRLKWRSHQMNTSLQLIKFYLLQQRTSVTLGGHTTTP